MTRSEADAMMEECEAERFSLGREIKSRGVTKARKEEISRDMDFLAQERDRYREIANLADGTLS